MNKAANLTERIADSLTAHAQREALLSAVKRGREARLATLEKLGRHGLFRDTVAGIKDRCIDKLPDLVAEFSQRAESRGAKVYFARSGKEACQYILDLANSKDAHVITKSKSLTTEEIELNYPLEKAGITVIETDLGERIIQMAGELPYHLVFPAVHKTAAQVAELFSEASGETVEPELDVIMKHMRSNLRPAFLKADIGITGANVAIAETGSFLIETNEGNGRLVSAIPPVHVCVMGAEKIVESIDDAMQMILAHPVSATGQILTTYVSIFAGRSPLSGIGDRELHIVILDNGRLNMRVERTFSEALHCIRCGACMNICPTYGAVGGHVFGHIYPGPIGIPWTAQVHGLDHAAEFSDLCISCGLCKEICPADIDIPMMIAKVKHQALKNKQQPLANRLLMANEELARLASATAPLSNWLLQSRLSRFVGHRFFGIDKRRELPQFSRRTFKQEFKNISQLYNNKEGEKKVALFVDYFANYIRPDLAHIATKMLAEVGVEVALPTQKSSGFPYISYGEIGKAKQVASFNVRHLADYVERGFDVVTLEPTAAYALRLVYPSLLNNSADAMLVGSRTFGFFEYLIAQHYGPGQFHAIPDKRAIGFHIPCHQRGHGGESALNFLELLG
ncbi:LUD domain-containing protein [bacterium]|nr:LUD domain-containing protein [bacterium]